MGLATTVIPLPGEALDGYLDRASHQLSVPVAALLHLFPRSAATGISSVWISPETTGVLARDLGLTEGEIHGMHLAGAFPKHYGLLSQKPDMKAVNRAAKDLWFSMAGSRYCPSCLAEEGIWKLVWRLPWSVVCLKHSRLLEDNCSGCGYAPRTGRHGTTRSLYRYGTVRDPKVCHNQNREPGRGQSAPECGNDLTMVQARPSEPSLARLQRQIDQILAGHPETVAGAQLPADAALQAWRELLVLDRHLNDSDRAPGRPWYTPPKTVDQTIARFQRMLRLADSATVREAAEALRPRLGPQVDANWFRDRLPDEPVLAAVYGQALSRHGRVSTQLRRLAERTSHQPPLPAYDYTSANVPQRIPESWMPQILRERKGKPSQAMLQTVIALAVARLVEGDWTDAARSLELPESKGRQWSNYAISRLSDEEKQALVDTTMRLANALSSKQTPRNYSAERVLVETASDLGCIPTDGEPRPR